MNVTVRPELLTWARNRASLTVAELAPKVGTKTKPAPIQEWEESDSPVEIPAKQLEKFAEKTRAPFGMLFLSEPPVEQLPIKDFRRPATGGSRQPSLNLLETIYDYQVKQSWLSSAFQEEGDEPLTFIGSASIRDSVTSVAADIRTRLRIGTEERQTARTSGDAVLWLIGRLAESRINVIRKSYFRTNTKSSLDPTEFKGFALANQYAPFIFINGKDWPSSQIFTIAHECVHLWLGESALPSGDWFAEATDPVERFCNQVAAEILIPTPELNRSWRTSDSIQANAVRIGREFRVSSLASLYRARNADIITESELQSVRAQFQADFERRPETRKGGGGDPYNNKGIELGKDFIRRVVARTLEGRTLYSEAFELLGTRNTDVVHTLAQRFL